MKKMNKTQIDEFNLTELSIALWNGKFIIGIFILLGTLIGFCYSQVAHPKYTVSVKHNINIFSIRAHQICGKQLKCLETVTRKRFLFLLEGDWNRNLSFSTSSPKKLKEYETQLERAVTLLNNEIYSEANTEIDIIQTELTDPIMSTDNISQKLLYAKRIINFIDDRQSVISFGSVSIVKTSLKMLKILAISFIFGGMIGMLIALFFHNIKNKKKQITVK